MASVQFMVRRAESSSIPAWEASQISDRRHRFDREFPLSWYG